jgi:hypothetical protein
MASHELSVQAKSDNKNAETKFSLFMISFCDIKICI